MTDKRAMELLTEIVKARADTAAAFEAMMAAGGTEDRQASDDAISAADARFAALLDDAARELGI